MFAAIVIHSVPADQRRLCWSPSSEYVCVKVTMRPFEFETSPVWMNGYGPPSAIQCAEPAELVRGPSRVCGAEGLVEQSRLDLGHP